MYQKYLYGIDFLGIRAICRNIAMKFLNELIMSWIDIAFCFHGNNVFHISSWWKDKYWNEGHSMYIKSNFVVLI